MKLFQFETSYWKPLEYAYIKKLFYLETSCSSLNDSFSIDQSCLHPRFLTDANGGSMDRRWQKEIHALELTIAAPWELVVRFANKYIFFFFLFPLIDTEHNLFHFI